jgi:hypothetical protein
MLSTDWSESYSILNSHNYDKKLFKRAFLYAIQYKQYYVCAIEYSTELHDAYWEKLLWKIDPGSLSWAFLNRWIIIHFLFI